MTDRHDIEENYRHIVKRIESACTKGGRAPEEVTLVAVSKTFSEQDIQILYGLGHRDFGENKVQELQQKALNLHARELAGIRWHMIGHLQRNKVRDVMGIVSMIHTVDSLRLANELNRRGEQIGRSIQCMIQVNISGETTKYGIPPHELQPLLTECEAFTHVKPVGLMAMPAPVEDPEDVRKDFIHLRDLLSRCNESKSQSNALTCLSMGMSGDFEVAVEEGATHIRIGSAIFGSRPRAG